MMAKKILVVEDDPLIRAAIQIGLESVGYRALGASNAGEVLSVLHNEERVDAVILDWLLPGTDGLSICRGLKSYPPTRHVPVIVLTAAASVERQTQALAAGAIAFLSKPFDLHELLSALAHAWQDSVDATVEPTEATEAAEHRVGDAILRDGLLIHSGTGDVIPLRPVERWVMVALARCDGVVSHDELCRAVRQGRGGRGGIMGRGALRETIRQINRKLRAVGLPQVQAQRGVGYYWLAHFRNLTKG